MLNFVMQARHSHFIRHNAVFFFGAVAVGALNYLYYPIMGRLLDPASFGEVQTLISLFLQITIFLSVMGLVTINIVTNYSSVARRNEVVLEFEKLALLIGVALLGVTIVGGPAIAHFLHFSSVWPFVLLLLALIASVPFTFRSAFLRGRKKFMLASAANLAMAASKLLFAALFIVVGLGSAGAIGGLVVAQIVASIIAAAWATKAGLTHGADSRIFGLPNFRLLLPELRYGALVLGGSLIVTLQYSLDVLVVKHYFNPHVAGLYAGVASVARIILFLTASVALVMMALVRAQAAPGKNQRLLLQSLLLTAVVGLPVWGVCLFAPQAVTLLLMGKAYAGIASILPTLASAVLVVSVVNVVVSYYLALRRYGILPVLGVGALVTYVLLYLHHASLQSVVTSLFVGSLAMLAVLGLWAGSNYLRETTWQKS